MIGNVMENKFILLQHLMILNILLIKNLIGNMKLFLGMRLKKKFKIINYLIVQYHLHYKKHNKIYINKIKIKNIMKH